MVEKFLILLIGSTFKNILASELISATVRFSGSLISISKTNRRSFFLMQSRFKRLNLISQSLKMGSSMFSKDYRMRENGQVYIKTGSTHKCLIVGPYLPQTLDPFRCETCAIVGNDGKRLKVVSVVGVEGKAVHIVHEIPHSLYVFQLFWGFFCGSAGEEVAEHVGNGASFSLIYVIEEPENIMAALQEQKVQDSNGLKDKGLVFALLFKVHARLLQVSRIIEKRSQKNLLLLQNVVIAMRDRKISQLEHLIHRVRVPHKENLQHLLEPTLRSKIKYLLADVAAKKLLPLEFPTKIGHDGIDIIDIQPLMDQQGQRCLVNPHPLEAINGLFRKSLLLFLVLQMNLHIAHSQIHEQISNGLHLAPHLEIRQNEKATFVCYHSQLNIYFLI